MLEPRAAICPATEALRSTSERSSDQTPVSALEYWGPDEALAAYPSTAYPSTTQNAPPDGVERRVRAGGVLEG